MPLRSVKLATMNESTLRIKLQPSEVPSVNFLRETGSPRHRPCWFSRFTKFPAHCCCFREELFRLCGGRDQREKYVEMILQEVFKQAGRDGRSHVLFLVRTPFQNERPDDFGFALGEHRNLDDGCQRASSVPSGAGRPGKSCSATGKVS